MKAFRIIGKAAVAFYDDLFHFLVMGFVTLVGCILVIPGPFVLGGLYAVAQRAVRGEGSGWAKYWGGVKEYGLRSFALALIVVLGYVLIGTNIWFYNTPEASPFSPTVAAWVTPLWIVAAVIWTSIAFYAEAFLVELEKPTIPIVLRNSLFLAAINPLPTLVFLVVFVVVLGLSIALPVLLVLSPSFLVTLAVTAVRTLVGEVMERAKSEAAPEAGLTVEPEDGTAAEAGADEEAVAEDPSGEPQ